MGCLDCCAVRHDDWDAFWQEFCICDWCVFHWEEMGGRTCVCYGRHGRGASDRYTSNCLLIGFYSVNAIFLCIVICWVPCWSFLLSVVGSAAVGSTPAWLCLECCVTIFVV